MNEKPLSVAVLGQPAAIDINHVNRLLTQAVNASNRKIIVLDDDPTGVQTVHDVSVYTDWSIPALQEAFASQEKMFFILTNSRAFSQKETEHAHREIAQNITLVAKETKTEFLLISRSDSTLRGHFPLETETLRRYLAQPVDGEIICPFFKEGGRLTFDNTHYVCEGDVLVPAALTEFAGDCTFGYAHSCLPEYIEEKTQGRYSAADTTCVALADLRALAIDKIEAQLLAVTDFRKVVVNATEDVDVKVFCIALYRALAKGKRFLYRTAASFVKAVGAISNRPLLTQAEMLTQSGFCGGMVVIGSHTKKTTAQLEALRALPGLAFMEMDSDLVLKEGALQAEVQRLIAESESLLVQGKTVVLYTKRTVLSLPHDTKETALARSVQISCAVQAVVAGLHLAPAFLVAKGGITSSDIGTKALRVRRATVLGQILPGLPVWKIGAESRFPAMPYIIFPGNVGETDTLARALQILMPKHGLSQRGKRGDSLC